MCLLSSSLPTELRCIDCLPLSCLVLVTAMTFAPHAVENTEHFFATFSKVCPPICKYFFH